MDSQRLGVRLVLFVLVVFTLILAAFYFLPLDRINWGRISILPAATVTVTGDAQGEQKTQIATFYAGVTATNDDKQKAIDEVNKKMTDLINSLKGFGIPEDDIKTQNVSVSENVEPVPLLYPNKPTRQGGWVANNSITVKLRNIDKASDLADLLNKSGATNVSGPSYAVDDTQTAQVELTAKAIENARQKAEAIAKAGGRTLGKLVNVVEGGVSYRPMPLGGAVSESSSKVPVQPGTQTVYQSITATFELK